MHDDRSYWRQQGWDSEDKPRGYIYKHHEILKKMTATVPSRRGTKKLYVVPKPDGGFEDLTNVKYLYRHKKDGQVVEGRLAVHSYEYQRLYDFIHSTLRQHHPEAFKKLRSGQFTDAPTPSKALKYARSVMIASRNLNSLLSG